MDKRDQFVPSDRPSSFVLPEGGEWPADAVETDFVVVNAQGNYDNFFTVERKSRRKMWRQIKRLLRRS